MQKPTGVTVTSALMAVAILIGLALAFTVALPAMPASTLSPALIVALVHGVAVFFSVVAAVFVWFYWKGQDWARWLVMIYSLYCLYSLIHLRRTWTLSHFSAEFIAAKAVLALYLLWYLNTAGVRAWFQKTPAPSAP
jgi:hypothetical protein